VNEDTELLQHARALVASGAHSAQILNERVFNVPEFKKWSNETLAVATACLAAGFAHVIEMPEDDFVTLCRVAHQLVRAEPKTTLVIQ
jgi:hypothetical protein